MAWPTTLQSTQAERVVAENTKVRIYAPALYVTTFDYDFAVSGGAISAITVSSQDVPVGAQVVGGWYQVSTTFITGGADAGTIALSIVGANDLVTAIAVSDASNPWDIDLTQRKPLKRVVTKIATAVPVVLTIAGQTVSAGVLFGCVEWVLPQNLSSGH